MHWLLKTTLDVRKTTLNVRTLNWIIYKQLKILNVNFLSAHVSFHSGSVMVHFLFLFF